MLRPPEVYCQEYNRDINETNYSYHSAEPGTTGWFGGKTAYQKASTAYMQWAIWVALIGVAFLTLALLQTGIAWFLVPISLLFTLGAFFLYRASRKYKS